MKKKLFLSLFAILVLTIPTVVGAISLGSDLADRAAQGAGYARTTETSFSETIGLGIKTALSFVGVIFLVLTVYAGFLWMMARGDEGQIEKAQKIIQSAIIGMIITVGAYSITAFVVPRIVGKTSGGNVRGGSTGGNVCEQRYDDCQNNCERTAGGNVGEAYDRCIESSCIRYDCNETCERQNNGNNVGDAFNQCITACTNAC